jgi:nicotinamide mononucleotide transporter
MKQLQHLLSGIGATEFLEYLAVLCAVLYVLLISFRNQWGWLFATINAIIYCIICYFSKLYLETGLQLFYVVMAIYGWYEWSDEDDDLEEKVRRWPLKIHLYILSFGVPLAALTGLLFFLFTDQANPYLDAFTTLFSLIATFMVTKKILENWLYWIVIDLVAMQLYNSRGLELTAALYFFYAVVSVFGYFNWKKNLITG